MKEAMGETTFTIIIIVAAAIIIGALTVFLPRIIKKIEDKWGGQIDEDYSTDAHYSYNLNAKEFVVGDYTFTV